MTFGTDPGIWADAVRKALNPSEERAARKNETGAERSALDKAELREVELSGVYGQSPPGDDTTDAARSWRIRSVIARVFHRST